jgi:hypothetical protein
MRALLTNVYLAYTKPASRTRGISSCPALTQADGVTHGPGTDLPTTSRFHNLSSGVADALGQADAVLKGAEAECKALKNEIKRRGLFEAAGDNFAIRVAEQISGRLDVAAVK